MHGCQSKRRSEQVGPFFVVIVRGFERTDVSKKTDARRSSSLAGSTDRASLTCRTGPLKITNSPGANLDALGAFAKRKSRPGIVVINLHRSTRKTGDRGQIGSELSRYDCRGCRVGLRPPRNDIGYFLISRWCHRNDGFGRHRLFEIFFRIQRQLDHAFQ